MIVCNRCGKENQDHYKFCLGCGAELTTPPAAKPGGDVAMMKTMMADTSGLGPLPQRPSGPTPMVPGAPGSPPPGLGGPPPGLGGIPGLQPPGLGAPPGMGGPPGLGGSPLPPLGPPPGAPGAPPMGPPPGLGGLGGLGGPPPGLGGMGGPLGSPLGTAPTAPPLGAPPSAGPPVGLPPGVPVGSPGFPPPPGMGGPTGQMGSAAPGAAPGMRRCPSCGSDVPPNFRFCGSCGFRMDDASGPASPPPGLPLGGAPRATANQFEQVRPQPKSTLTLIRPDGSEGGVYELKTGENKIGRGSGGVFENDGYLSPVHAELVVNAAGAVVRDLDSLNGVFVKMTDEEEIQSGQVLRIGQELLRFDLINPPEPAPDGTEVMGSPNPGFWGKITTIIGRDVDGSAFPLLGESVTLGRERGEINFPDDGYVSGLHAKITTRDGRVFLADLGSSNGSFVKVQGERALRNESFVLLGQQLFRLNLVV
ncbi:MAG TPA: FHA domain-containing protein [Kofleriaceae bacterium]|nr:FHA domain-containing protein [Kofleriaceae bacterium]